MSSDESWKGWLIQIKTEWLNPNEKQQVYIVLEDCGTHILIQRLTQTKLILCTESVLKEWVDVIDKDIQNYNVGGKHNV
jgi:hypothetical protein